MELGSLYLKQERGLRQLVIYDSTGEYRSYAIHIEKAIQIREVEPFLEPPGERRAGIR